MAKTPRVLTFISCIYYLPCRPTKPGNFFSCFRSLENNSLLQNQIFCPETSVTNHQSTLCKIPEKNEDLEYTAAEARYHERSNCIFFFFLNSRGTECTQIPSEVHSLHIFHSTYFLFFVRLFSFQKHTYSL